MSHTYTSAHYHCVFSTKHHERHLTPELRQRLWPYMGGIAKEHGMKALAVGGVEDHVHLLISLPAKISVSKAMQLIKGGSSKWVHDTFPDKRAFAWQEGYGAFAVGVSQIADTVAYINGQEEHHRKRSFKEEFVAFLKKHDLKYDERFVWG